MAHDVFISYATSDKAIADAVCSQLESVHRIRCWIAPRDVTPGANWAESIIDALDSSKIMVLIFSSSANASVQIEREVERAVHKGVNIIPLRIEAAQPTKTLEYFISAPHWLDALTVPLEQHISRLAVAVKALLARPTPVLQGTATEVTATPHVLVPPPEALPEPADAVSQGPSPRVFIVGAAVAGLVLLAMALGRQAGPASDPPASDEGTLAASPLASVPEGQGQTPSTAPPDAPAGATAAPIAPPAPAQPSPARVPGAIAAAPAGRNTIAIDFRNVVDEGAILLEIDGQRAWSELLGNGVAPGAGDSLPVGVLRPGAGVPEGPVATSITVPRSATKATVTLFDRNAAIRDTRSIDLPAPLAAATRTLQIRLSRFRRDVQLRLVDTPERADSAASGGTN